MIALPDARVQGPRDVGFMYCGRRSMFIITMVSVFVFDVQEKRDFKRFSECSQRDSRIQILKYEPGTMWLTIW